MKQIILLIAVGLIGSTGNGPANVLVNDQPGFEVATIRPTGPNPSRTGFRINGHRVSMTNETVNNVIELAYAVHKEQIEGCPAWCGNDRYDIEGIADINGEPSFKQMQGMYQALLADRFGLKFHKEKKELSVYALRLDNGSAKLIKSKGDPNAQPDQEGNQNGMTVTNASMSDLALMLQFMLDRPVVDQTNLAGKYDLHLKWTPADAPPNTAPDAPPGLFTAIREQLGLKLEPTKAMDDVLMVDHVDKPTPN